MKPKYVTYANFLGRPRKMTWARARDTALADFDRSPRGYSAKIEIYNERLKGATMEQFLAEREDARQFAARDPFARHAAAGSS